VRLLNSCSQSRIEVNHDTNTVQDPPPAPFFRDYNKNLWAKADGEGSVFYFYPLQPTFFYDTNNNDVSEGSDFDCIPWLARLPVDQGGTADPTKPIEVAYSIAWPSNIPVLVVGETLLSPKRGLPDIVDQASVQVVFDEAKTTAEEAGDHAPENALVQLIAPISERHAALAVVPGDIATELDEQGKTVLLGSTDGTKKLPVALRNRLRWDSIEKKLTFKGIYEPVPAPGMFLINVMSKKDRAALLALNSGSPWQTAVNALFHETRNPHEISKICTTQIVNNGVEQCLAFRGVTDDDVLIGWQDEEGGPGGDGILEPFKALGEKPGLTAGFSHGTGFVTVAFNNDPSLTPLPISLNVIRVDCLAPLPAPLPPQSTYQGFIHVMTSENVFDETMTLRHDGDFGGNPDALQFEWYYHPDADGLPPQPLPDPDNGQLNGWLKFPTPAGGAGANDITIAGADITTLSDNWFVTRYKGLPACGNNVNFSVFAGQPGATPTQPLAMLAPGWVKRVVTALNPFEARVKAFHAGPTNTFASMLVQLGHRYEGDIALNNDPNNLNNIGLIEAYETVLRRAEKLSVDGTPPVNYPPVNTAILNVASRISDFYNLLGNEAYADAVDPTIGITTGDVDSFGSLAPTIFNFQNQVDNLLTEELDLLRGRDDTNASVHAPPVYDRMFWNFTNGEGEVAYALSYNITDQNHDGIINATDAQILFPQGHGDAWGHYLTAMTTYYQLLRHPYYSWLTRPEAVIVGGSPIQVDYLDERKFAKTAAAKAKVGAEVVNLTYRSAYVEDPEGQFQGYKDTNKLRAWGVDEWARRAGQGAFFDWVVGNSIVPAKDPNPNHVGIQKIERATVTELAEIASNYDAIQSRLDQADHGLNPLGLAKGVVPFDLNTADVVDPIFGSTHFEQILERAESALENTVKVWDFANDLTRMLRNTQDSVDELTKNSRENEIDYKDRLIEIFGYPYGADIGTGGTYPQDFDGPDLYHYMIVDAPQLKGTALDIDDVGSGPIRKVTEFKASWSPMFGGVNFFDIDKSNLSSLDCGADPFGDGCSLGDPQENNSKCTGNGAPEACCTGAGAGHCAARLEPTYVTWTDPDAGLSFIKPAAWGTSERRAQGRLQEDIFEITQARIDMKKALQEYNDLFASIENMVSTWRATFNVEREKLKIENAERKKENQYAASIAAMKSLSIGLQRTAKFIDAQFKDASECMPKSTIIGVAAGGDLMSGIRCCLDSVGDGVSFGFDTAADAVEIVDNALEAAKEDVSLSSAIQLNVQDARLEFFNQKGEIDEKIREEPALRAEIYARVEEVRQAQAKFRTDLAEGQRILEQLVTFRKDTAAAVQQYRYSDMAFRIFRNDALQKYRAQFDLAARYTYLAATAYDYETNLLGTDTRAGRDFLTDIVRQRSLGQILDGEPVPGSPGLADPLGRMQANFTVLKTQLGFNNPQFETNRFSLKHEMLRFGDDDEGNGKWRQQLAAYRVDDLWKVPVFRRYARPFAPESLGPQPGLVIPFSSTVTFGLNFFGWPLGAGDNAYDPTHFATKIRGVGVWFKNYQGLPLSNTPRVYLFPAGADVLRSPDPFNFRTREWTVIDQVLPVPFPIGSNDLETDNWLPLTDTLSGNFGQIRRYGALLARNLEEGSFDLTDMITDTRLVGRSVWNTQWVLIIPGGTLLNDPNQGLDTFVNGVDDISIFFDTYSYTGN